MPRTETPHEEEDQPNFSSIVQDYMKLDVEAQAAIPFDQFNNAKRGFGSDGGQRLQRVIKDLQHKVSKLSLLTFDGSGKVTAHAWVQKLDTYFSLSPMTKDEAIKFAILHLEGLAHEWWNHGIVTQGFGLMTTYVDHTKTNGKI